MKQFKQLFQQNAQLLGLGITNNCSECSTLRNSFSDYFYTERSMISEANEETNEKKRNKINHQLSILQGSLMGKKQENSVKKRKIKYMRDENIKPKQINVTSKQLHQIRRFDPKLYEEYLSLYHEYKLKTKINEQTKLVLERYRL